MWPLWFVWDGENFLIFSQPNKAKVRQINANPKVCLHLDPDAWGENIVIVSGEARIAPDQWPTSPDPEGTAIVPPGLEPPPGHHGP